jgi:hypothetical protein
VDSSGIQRTWTGNYLQNLSAGQRAEEVVKSVQTIYSSVFETPLLVEDESMYAKPR